MDHPDGLERGEGMLGFIGGPGISQVLLKRLVGRKYDPLLHHHIG
jgi:hypothetical protein